jgi:ABC-2 type transport system permease protein
MLRGLLGLTWLEIKIFMREPLGAIGSFVVPVLVYIVLGRVTGSRLPPGAAASSEMMRVTLPVFGAVVIIINAVLSLITIIAIYREGGILKRLRATPLRPHTILTAHVLVKLGFTALTLLLMVLAGRRYYPADVHIPIVNVTLALLIATCSILSIGFVVASMVRTARFAQPAGALLFYPMFGLCGLFLPLDALPPALHTLARFVPLTYAVSLLKGMMQRDSWSAHMTDVGALGLVFVICIAVSSRVFRWE